MHEMGLRTESLDPPHNYVPWVVVDGVHNTTIQNMAMADLTALVCQTYQVYIGCTALLIIVSSFLHVPSNLSKASCGYTVKKVNDFPLPHRH
jgi:hypothetical protein